MNTPNWKHIELNTKAYFAIILAVLTSMFVNVDMYGQVYRNGKLIEDIDQRYMQLSYEHELSCNGERRYQTYMQLGKYSAGYALAITCIAENEYPDIDTMQCRHAVLYGKDGELTLERISGKSVYEFEEEKTIGPDNWVRAPQTVPFMRYRYMFIYRIDDIDKFLEQDFTQYSFLDGKVSYSLASNSKEQRRFNKQIKAGKKYIDLWYKRHMKLSGYDDSRMSFIILK